MAKDANDFFKGGSEPFRAFFDMQGEAMREMMGQLAPGKFGTKFPGATLDPGDMAEFANVAREIQAMWFKFMAERSQDNESNTNPFDPAQWLTLAQGMAKQIPTDPIDTAQRLAKDSMEIWQGVLGSFLGGGSKLEAPDADALPRKDRRFAAEESGFPQDQVGELQAHNRNQGTEPAQGHAALDQRSEERSANAHRRRSF